MPHLVAELRGGCKAGCSIAAVYLKQERIPVLIHKFLGQEETEDLDMSPVKDGECRKHWKGLVAKCYAGQTMRHVAVRSDASKLFLNLHLPSRGENLDVITEQDKVVHTGFFYRILCPG